MLNPKSKIQNPKKKFCHWVFVFVIYFEFCALVFGFCSNAYALDLTLIKACFLKGDYKSVITEGEKIMGSAAGNSYGLDELYYILGLSYLKDSNYLRAADIFEIILREFKESAFGDQAKLALGDTYFLKGEYERAQIYYKELADDKAGNKLMALAYQRISQCALKTGNTREAENYLAKLKAEFPLAINSGIQLNKETAISLEDIYYTVQIGSFLNIANARNLTQELAGKGYPAYLEEPDPQKEAAYRVRVGKFRLKQEAVDLEKKLAALGYPTKIFP
jgi:tetratricopeptide (TPR) repeat protein